MSTVTTISARDYYGRLLRKLRRPGVLKSLLAINKMSGGDVGSLGLQLERTAELHPDRPAVVFEGRTWTWAELNSWSNRYARTLAAQGVGRGDVVAVLVANRPELLAVLMGTLKLGAVAAMVNTSLRGSSLAHCLTVARATAMVVGEEQVGALGTTGEEVQTYAATTFFLADVGVTAEAADTYLPDAQATPVPAGWIDLEQASADADGSNLSVTAELTLGEPAVYIYTSGTTGMPKAAVTTHARLVLGGTMVGRVVRELSPDDVVYGPLPLYHSTGLLGGWSACLHTGAAFVPARRFSASGFWDEVRRYDATTFNYVGEVLRYLHNQPAGPGDRDHRVRSMFGAGLRPDIWDGFKERFGIEQVHEIYGGSESPAGFMNLLNYDRTCGWNPRGWKLAVYDPESGGPRIDETGFAVAAGPGEQGLLLFKVDEKQVFAGYTDKDANERKLIRDVFKAGDCWFDSGDLMLNQGHGHVAFVDRTGDTFRWQSENVATTEVEAVLNRWGQVEDAAVFGVEVPGADGRCGMARLVLADGETLDAVGLARHLRSELPAYAVPRFLRVAPEMQMTGSFKHQKNDLKEEGFDLARVDEPVWILPPSSEGWLELDAATLEELAAGEIRL